MREGQKLDKIKVHNTVNGDASVLASEGVFQEILFNLFNNAFEAMHGTGELFISAQSNGDFVEIKFRDTGPGISKEALSNIFEPYFTTKQDSEAVGSHNVAASKMLSLADPLLYPSSMLGLSSGAGNDDDAWVNACRIDWSMASG